MTACVLMFCGWIGATDLRCHPDILPPSIVGSAVVRFTADHASRQDRGAQLVWLVAQRHLLGPENNPVFERARVAFADCGS